MKFELADAINWYVVFLFSLCCHEAAHAWAASLLGDNTAKHAGQVTLDPTPHIKRAPFGTVVVPLLSFLFSGSIIGWAHAPYDPVWAQRYPRRCMVMSMAGPLANLMIALLALSVIRVGCEWHVLRVSASAPLSQMVSAAGDPAGIWSFVAKIVSITYKLNVLLCVFNLLPFPPLDGSKIPLAILPQSLASKYWSILNHPSLAWVGSYCAWHVFGIISPAVFDAASRVLNAINLG